MDYTQLGYTHFVAAIQVVGLVTLAGSAVALLRLITIHFIQHDWTTREARPLHIATTMLSAGLLLFAFSTGGILATHLFETNQLPPLPLFALQVTLMLVLTATSVFLHVVAGPWLVEYCERAEPLVVSLGINRLMAMTLAFSGFAASWLIWVVMAWPSAMPPQVTEAFAALALTTLLLWAVLAVPAGLLRLTAIYAGLVSQPLVPVQDQQRRTMPMLPEIPEYRPAHVPAPRAPRPLLMSQGDLFNG